MAEPNPKIRRIYVKLSAAEIEKLVAMATAHRRSPANEAALLLEEAMRSAAAREKGADPNG